MEASVQESPSDVVGHLVVYHWPAVRSALLLVVFVVLVFVARRRRRR